jgi:hypothetical protein
MFDPANVLSSLIEGFERLNAIERVLTPKARVGGVEAAKLVKQARRQRASLCAGSCGTSLHIFV